MKKLLSWLLIGAMLLSLPLTVFANTTDSAGSEQATATPIPLGYDTNVFKGGENWLFAAPDQNGKGDTVFKPLSATGECDAVTLSDMMKGTTASRAGILKYQKTTPASYSVSFDVKLDDLNKGTFGVYFYWQGLTDGRTFANNMKATGYALRVTADGDSLYYDVLGYSATGAYSRYNTPASGTRYSADFMKEAAAGAELTFTLSWDPTTKVVSANVTRKDTSAELPVTFNISTHQYIDAVTAPESFAVLDYCANPLASLGNITVTDLTVTDSTATHIPLGFKDGVFYGGDNWAIYTPDQNGNGNSVFQPTATDGACDSVTLSEMLKTATGSYAGVMMYQKKNPESFTVTYDISLGENNYGKVSTYFYWQQLKDGRTFPVNMKATGYTLAVTSDNQGIYYDVLTYNAAGGYGKISTPTTGTRFSADFLKDAPANAQLQISLTWDASTKTVSAVLTRKDTNATMPVSFDLSKHANIGFVTDPEGIAIVDYGANPVASIGNVAMTGVQTAIVDNFDHSTIDSNFANVANGDNFVLGADGWYTRSGEVAKDIATLTYKYAPTYNYELSFNIRLNAENKGRVAMWNIWDGKFGGTHYGYMLNINTLSNGTIEYRLARYSPKYDSKTTDFVAEDQKANLSSATLLKDQAPNAELAVKITLQDRTMTVVTSLANDPTKTMGTVTFDFSGESEKQVHKNVNRSTGFALMDMAIQLDGGAGVSTAIGNISYTPLPGVEPPPEVEPDNNDYSAILNKNDYAWNGSIDVKPENFDVYSYNAQNDELFQFTDGWLTRTNANGETLEQNRNAYANAQYKGVMDPGDYKLTFSIITNDDNRCRVSVLTRWDDNQNMSSVNFKSQTGYRLYIYVDAENKLQVFCYQTDGSRYLAPTDATKDNEYATFLQGLETKNAQLDVTVVMKDDLAVVEVHLASDPTKTTGPVAFKLSENKTLYSSIDKTQGFLFVDGATEAMIEPAKIGNIKVYAAAAPVVDGKPAGPSINPDDLIDPVESKPQNQNPSTPNNTDEGTKAPENNEKAGCKSSASLSLCGIVMIAGAAGIVCKKKKHGDQ